MTIYDLSLCPYLLITVFKSSPFFGRQPAAPTHQRNKVLMQAGIRY